jgi:hypothetical protein
MKSSLLILGAAITILNHAAHAAAESKLLNVSQKEHYNLIHKTVICFATVCNCNSRKILFHLVLQIEVGCS